MCNAPLFGRYPLRKQEARQASEAALYIDTAGRYNKQKRRAWYVSLLPRPGRYGRQQPAGRGDVKGAYLGPQANKFSHTLKNLFANVGATR